ncbi:MAG: alpha-glucosidase/alpha-galactosidase [Ardenticatenaceae bacterium]|nr:alpha-glucosidase/alpha-galactosidase [Ardenticatenaceae bacterium]
MSRNMDPKNLKIAYIGGGSRMWARTLMADLALEPELNGRIELYDIDFPAAKLNETLGNWIGTRPEARSQWQYKAVETLPQALQDADFVIISIQPGSFELMAHEIAVAEKYGMFFPVGDTTGVPGLMRGLRSAITFAGFAREIATHCPDAWVINYTNPMTICTRMLTKVAPELKVFGCCHEVFGTQNILADIAQKQLDLPEKPHRDEIRVNVLGINHFTWLDAAQYREVDLLALLREYIQEPGVLRPFTRQEVEAQNNIYYDGRQIKFELFKRYGILAAAGDRHLAEFVPGFTISPEELFRWGVIRTPVAYRIKTWQEIGQQVPQIVNGERPFTLKQSDEEAILQIKALLGLGDIITNVNKENVGQMANLPPRVVVETNARFSRDRVEPIAAGALPVGVHTLVSTHVQNQEMIVEAALTGNEELAFQAVFNDPCTTVPIDQAWQMFQEIGLPEGF